MFKQIVKERAVVPGIKLEDKRESNDSLDNDILDMVIASSGEPSITPYNDQHSNKNLLSRLKPANNQS